MTFSESSIKYIIFDQHVKQKQKDLLNIKNMNIQLYVSSVMWWFNKRLESASNIQNNKDRKTLLVLIENDRKLYIKSLYKT